MLQSGGLFSLQKFPLTFAEILYAIIWFMDSAITEILIFVYTVVINCTQMA